VTRRRLKTRNLEGSHMPAIETALTRLLAIEHPIILAPMGSAAGGKLASAVTNAGGLGMIGSGQARCDDDPQGAL
jgi:NAD(P)H-dependent flavin oxidoreductase YrpB (nitropropane dioxygenase family)